MELTLGQKLIQETVETLRKIREHIRTTRSRQKSYADKRRRSLEFDIGHRAFLKVSSTKGRRRFGVRDKLSPRYIGPCEIIEKLNLIAYGLNLSVDLEHVHSVFHISQLRKCVLDPNHGIITGNSPALKPR